MPSPPKNKAKENTMSPEEISAANQGGINFLAENFPMHTIGDAQGASEDAWGNMMSMFMPMFGGMVQSGHDNFDANPMKTATAVLADQTLGTTTSDGMPGTEMSAREKRIQEIMKKRGVTREEAERNQDRVIAMGYDLNDDGAVDNNEFGIALGQDLDGDGVRSKEEIAQWRKDNKDHFAAGGTKHGGLLDNLQTTPFGTIQGLDERRAMEAQQAQQGQQAPPGQQPPPAAGVMPMPNMGGQPQNIGQPQVSPVGIQGGPGQAQVAPAGPQTNAPPSVGVMPMPNIGGQMPSIGQPQGGLLQDLMKPRPKEEAGQPADAYVPNRFMSPRPRGGRR